jgi:hypothetical protein
VLFQRDIARLEEASLVFDGITDDAHQLDRSCQLQLLRNARHVQQVVDEPCELGGLPIDHLPRA